MSSKYIFVNDADPVWMIESIKPKTKTDLL